MVIHRIVLYVPSQNEKAHRFQDRLTNIKRWSLLWSKGPNSETSRGANQKVLDGHVSSIAVFYLIKLQEKSLLESTILFVVLAGPPRQEFANLAILIVK